MRNVNHARNATAILCSTSITTGSSEAAQRMPAAIARVLRIVLVPAILQRLVGSGHRDRQDQLGLEAGLRQVEGECRMVVAGCLEHDADRQIMLLQQRGQVIEVSAGVEHREPPTALPARHLDENFMAALGDDGCEARHDLNQRIVPEV